MVPKPILFQNPDHILQHFQPVVFRPHVLYRFLPNISHSPQPAPGIVTGEGVPSGSCRWGRMDGAGTEALPAGSAGDPGLSGLGAFRYLGRCVLRARQAGTQTVLPTFQLLWANQFSSIIYWALALGHCARGQACNSAHGATKTLSLSHTEGRDSGLWYIKSMRETWEVINSNSFLSSEHMRSCTKNIFKTV